MDYTWKQHSSLGLGYLQYLSAFSDWILFMPNPSTWTEISSKGKQAAGYANTQINNVSFNCVNWNLYHGQIWLSVSYFDGQWSEGIMPRVAFCSSKAVESIGPACFKPVLLPWIQNFLYPREHLAMTGDVFSCHNCRQWKGYCHWNIVDRLGMHPNILQHTGTPSSLPNRELFGFKCQQW